MGTIVSRVRMSTSLPYCMWQKGGNPASCQADAPHSSREGQPPSPTHLFASLHCRPTTFTPAPRNPTAPPPPGKQQPLIGRSAGKAGAYKGNLRMVPTPLQQPQFSHSEMDNWDDQPPLVPHCPRAPHVEESSLWDFFYGDRDDLFPSWTVPAAHVTAKACVGAHMPSPARPRAPAAHATAKACVGLHVPSSTFASAAVSTAASPPASVSASQSGFPRPRRRARRHRTSLEAQPDAFVSKFSAPPAAEDSPVPPAAKVSAIPLADAEDPPAHATAQACVGVHVPVQPAEESSVPPAIQGPAPPATAKACKGVHVPPPAFADIPPPLAFADVPPPPAFADVPPAFAVVPPQSEAADALKSREGFQGDPPLFHDAPEFCEAVQEDPPPFHDAPEFCEAVQEDPPSFHDAPEFCEAVQEDPPPFHDAPEFCEAVQGDPPPVSAPQSGEAVQGDPPPVSAPQSGEAVQGDPPPFHDAPEFCEAVQGDPPPVSAPQSGEAVQGDPPPVSAPQSGEGPALELHVWQTGMRLRHQPPETLLRRRRGRPP
ncbi:pollen-specific leucine-rich repeat extensin-like protein 3 isoform X2 [Fundulus heteroclitus]|nr:pollen-specific leucine-rich repeat extensin-like protein 3 isoform X2 [Fundulus heteroclitus]